MYFVYILYCPETDLSYVGQTDHLIYRFYRHRDGKSRWTRRMKKPLVIYWEMLDSRSEAIKREKYYKQGFGFRQRKDLVNRYIAEKYEC